MSGHAEGWEHFYDMSEEELEAVLDDDSVPNTAKKIAASALVSLALLETVDFQSIIEEGA